jgi:hypothetical protein
MIASEMKGVLQQEGLIAFNVNPTAQEDESLQRLRIENESLRTQRELREFNHFGPVNDDLAQRLTGYIGILGNNPQRNILPLSGLILRIARSSTEFFEAEAAWVCVRASLPSDEFDTPRWHTDQKYFTADGRIYKTIFTVKGPPTRFARVVDAREHKRIKEKYTRDFFLKLRNNPEAVKEEDLRMRRELMATVEELPSFGRERAVIYLVGDEEAKVHSVPVLSEPRLFMQVLNGSHGQIDEWMQKKLSFEK